MKNTYLPVLLLTATLSATALQAANDHGKPHNPPKNQQAVERFMKMDSNKDGIVSKKEMMNFTEKRFSKLDANGDKVITQNELKAFRKEKRLQKLDTNKDGIISKDERHSAKHANKRCNHKSDHAH